MPFTVKRPAVNSRSAAATSSTWLAIRMPLAMISLDALSMTMLPSRSARPECEPPPTETRSRVAGDQQHAVDRHAKPFADQLGKTGFVTLATGDRADDDLHGAFRLHGDLGPLARHAGRGIDVVGDADAAIFAACLRLGAARRKAGPLAQPHARAPSPRDRRRCRRPCRTDCDTASRFRHEVAPAQFDAIKAALPRREIDQPLHDEHRLRPAGAAIGPRRGGIGQHGTRAEMHGRDVVDAGHDLDALLQRAEGDRIRADVDDVVAAQRQEIPSASSASSASQVRSRA